MYLSNQSLDIDNIVSKALSPSLRMFIGVRLGNTERLLESHTFFFFRKNFSEIQCFEWSQGKHDSVTKWNPSTILSGAISGLDVGKRLPKSALQLHERKLLAITD